MNADKRIYQYVGLLTIRKSRTLKECIAPKDDILSWLFLVVDEKRFTFFYKIERPQMAFYETPFNIQMSFIMDDIDEFIEMGQTYDVWRGEECIGKVMLIKHNTRI